MQKNLKLISILGFEAIKITNSWRGQYGDGSWFGISIQVEW
jgi:hypothetical protein